MVDVSELLRISIPREELTVISSKLHYIVVAAESGEVDSVVDTNEGVCWVFHFMPSVYPVFKMVLDFTCKEFGYRDTTFPLPKGSCKDTSREIYMNINYKKWEGEQLEWRIQFMKELIEVCDGILGGE